MDNPLDQHLCTLRFDFHVIFVGFKMAEEPRPDIDDSPTKQTRPIFFFFLKLFPLDETLINEAKIALIQTVHFRDLLTYFLLEKNFPDL